jgi:hypothetical protein
MGMAECAVVVPDRSDIVWIGFEKELRRGVHSARRLTAVWTVGRLTGFVDWSLDIEGLFAAIASIIVTSHPSPPGSACPGQLPSYPILDRGWLHGHRHCY